MSVDPAGERSDGAPISPPLRDVHTAGPPAPRQWILTLAIATGAIFIVAAVLIGVLALRSLMAGRAADRAVKQAMDGARTGPVGAGPLVDDPSPNRSEQREHVGAGWGHLRGRFVVQGALPDLPKPVLTQDAAHCSKCDVRNESIVVGPKQELANVVVWLRGKTAEIHDSYRKTEAAEVTLDNHKCRFEPHICLLRTTQTLKILNSDPILHNVKFDSASQAFGATIPITSPHAKKFTLPEAAPIPVACSIHPWMHGYLLVRDNPYMALTGPDGTFEIKSLPAGQWEFQVWHEMSGDLAVGDWKRGRFKVPIAADETHDLGTIEVPAKLLEPR